MTTLQIYDEALAILREWFDGQRPAAGGDRTLT